MADDDNIWSFLLIRTTQHLIFNPLTDHETFIPDRTWLILLTVVNHFFDHANILIHKIILIKLTIGLVTPF